MTEDRRPTSHRGFPLEAWQVPGQKLAGFMHAEPKPPIDPKYEQMARDRDARVEAEYQALRARFPKAFLPRIR